MIAQRLYRKLAITLLPGCLLSAAALAQPHDASVANHEPHYYDIADFDMQAGDVNYAEHIAPVLQRSCVQCH